MFSGFFATVTAAIRAVFDWHEHQWREEPLRHEPATGAYWIDRRCRRCPRVERRLYLKGERSGDATELVPDPFTTWYKVEGA